MSTIVKTTLTTLLSMLLATTVVAETHTLKEQKWERDKYEKPSETQTLDGVKYTMPTEFRNQEHNEKLYVEYAYFLPKESRNKWTKTISVFQTKLDDLKSYENAITQSYESSQNNPTYKIFTPQLSKKGWLYIDEIAFFPPTKQQTDSVSYDATPYYEINLKRSTLTRCGLTTVSYSEKRPKNLSTKQVDKESKQKYEKFFKDNVDLIETGCE